MKHDDGTLIGRKDRKEDSKLPEPTRGNLGERIVRIPPPIEPKG